MMYKQYHFLEWDDRNYSQMIELPFIPTVDMALEFANVFCVVKDITYIYDTGIFHITSTIIADHIEVVESKLLENGWKRCMR